MQQGRASIILWSGKRGHVLYEPRTTHASGPLEAATPGEDGMAEMLNRPFGTILLAGAFLQQALRGGRSAAVLSVASRSLAAREVIRAAESPARVTAMSVP